MKASVKVFGLLFLTLIMGCDKTSLQSPSMVRGDPEQKETQEKSFKIKEVSIQPMATYKIRARVLAKERYRVDDFSKVAPWDMVLGWDSMEDSNKIKDWNIDISQSGRFYYWKIPEYDDVKIQTIIQHSANVHMIPHNRYIAKQLDTIKTKEVYELEGYLVNVQTTKRLYQTSLSRRDTGAGACEIFYVKFIHRIE